VLRISLGVQPALVVAQHARHRERPHAEAAHAARRHRAIAGAVKVFFMSDKSHGRPPMRIITSVAHSGVFSSPHSSGATGAIALGRTTDWTGASAGFAAISFAACCGALTAGTPLVAGPVDGLADCPRRRGSDLLDECAIAGPAV